MRMVCWTRYPHLIAALLFSTYCVVILIKWDKCGDFCDDRMRNERYPRKCWFLATESLCGFWPCNYTTIKDLLVRGKKWDNCNSIINKIYLKKDLLALWVIVLFFYRLILYHIIWIHYIRIKYIKYLFHHLRICKNLRTDY